ncbi:MAG: hydroxyacylglutathione hydrolase [Desulfofustis sp.]|nr:hydroxyacylglutathione hydrolase [Desulfofustis sp.]
MEVVVVPCLYDNYTYLIIKGKQAAVVDPSEAWPVMNIIDDRGLELSAVLCTHHHHDHIGGLADLLDEYGSLDVYGFFQDRTRIPLITQPLQDNESFSVCDLEATVMHTPGHTSTHVVFCVEDHLFVGDTLFGAGCGRLFEGTAEQMVHSLDRISACGSQCSVFFGHEYTELNLRFAAQVDPTNPAIGKRAARVADMRREDRPSAPSTLQEELETNPFLRIEDGAIIDQLKREERLESSGRVAVFAALREQRNNFS